MTNNQTTKLTQLLTPFVAVLLCLVQACGGDDDWRPGEGGGSSGFIQRALINNPDQGTLAHTQQVQFRIPSNSYIFPVQIINPLDSYFERYLLFGNSDDTQTFSGNLLNNVEWGGTVIELPRPAGQDLASGIQSSIISKFETPKYVALPAGELDFPNEPETPNFVREFILETEDAVAVDQLLFDLLGAVHSPTQDTANLIDFTGGTSPTHSEFRLRITFHTGISGTNVFILTLSPETISGQFDSEIDVFHNPDNISFP